MPIAAMATGTRSNVPSVVLREDTRPPAYEEKYSEGASRTFYTKYTEHIKRVAHANAGGAIQCEVVPMAELIPSHVQKDFARVYNESRTITPTQLVVAVESHVGHGDGAKVEAFSQSFTSTPLHAAWLEMGSFLGQVGMPSVWPGRSYCAQLHGAIPSAIRW